MKAVDTNVLIYAIDATVRAKHERAIGLMHDWRQAVDRPVLPWQVACEYLAYLHRQQSQLRFAHTRVGEEFQNLIDHFRLILPEDDLLRISMQLFDRHSLSHWDSLLLAACISAGVDTLYSEDMSHGVTYDSVTVINPFHDQK